MLGHWKGSTALFGAHSRLVLDGVGGSDNNLGPVDMPRYQLSTKSSSVTGYGQDTMYQMQRERVCPKLVRTIGDLSDEP